MTYKNNDMEKYYLQFPPEDPCIVLFDDLPEQVKIFLNKDKRLEKVQVFSNAQVVAEHNYKLLKNYTIKAFTFCAM